MPAAGSVRASAFFEAQTGYATCVSAFYRTNRLRDVREHAKAPPPGGAGGGRGALLAVRRRRNISRRFSFDNFSLCACGVKEKSGYGR